MVRLPWFNWTFSLSLAIRVLLAVNSHSSFITVILTFFIYVFCVDTLVESGNHYVNRTNMDRVKGIWYLSPMRAAKVQTSLRILAVSPEPSLLAHTSSKSSRAFRQKARSMAPLNGWACAVKICHDGMLEDTNSLDGAHMSFWNFGIMLTSRTIMRRWNKIGAQGDDLWK